MLMNSKITRFAVQNDKAEVPFTEELLACHALWSPLITWTLPRKNAFLIFPQTDYVALGDFFFHESKIAQPDDAFVDRIRCVHKDLVETCLSGPRIWSNEGSLLSAVSVWSTAPESTALGGFFYGNGIHDQRPGITFWCLKNSSFQVINRA